MPAERLLEQFEGFVYEWTTKVLKVRNNLDKMDAKDMLVSIFALDRDARLLSYGLDLRGITVDRDGETPEALERQRAQIADLQRFSIGELVDDEDADVFEKDRIVLNLYCTMRFSELDLLKIFFQVYNDARCHFLFEIVGISERRYLSAEWIRLNATTGEPTFEDYRAMLLAKLHNSTKIDLLLTYVQKPREEGLQLSLWLAERMSDRELLVEDGVQMDADTWLAFTLQFVTNKERQILKVPPEGTRHEFNNGVGYNLDDLKQAVDEYDSSMFERFHQSMCRDPVAKRLLQQHRLFKKEKMSPVAPLGDKEKKDYKPPFRKGPPYAPKQAYPMEVEEEVQLVSFAAAQNDLVSALPQANSKPDQIIYSKYKDGGLRQKLWKHIKAKECVRCGAAGHLRSACKLPERSWEKDFNQPGFWTARSTVKPRAKQVRVQLMLTSSSAGGRSKIITVRHGSGLIALDTCSDVSLAKRGFLRNVRKSLTPVSVESMEGMTYLEEEGELEISPSEQITVFVSERIPPNCFALLGVEEIEKLSLSLDSTLRRANLSLEQARIEYNVPTLAPPRNPAVTNRPSSKSSSLAPKGSFWLFVSTFWQYIAPVTANRKNEEEKLSFLVHDQPNSPEMAVVTFFRFFWVLWVFAMFFGDSVYFKALFRNWNQLRRK